MKKKLLMPLVGLGIWGGFLITQPFLTYATQFGGGDGSGNHPYLISKPEHLNELREAIAEGNTYKGVYFQQTTSIDFANYDCDQDSSNGNFSSIGTVESPFEGYYNGNYHTIANVHIQSESPTIGFFGKIANGAMIENLMFDQLTIIGSGTAIGSVVGQIENGKISDVQVTDGLVHSTSSDAEGSVGGVLGESTHASSELEAISFSGSINSESVITGGIVGKITKGQTFQDLSFKGSIESTQGLIGGLIGEITSSVTVKNGLVQAQLKGEKIGGLAGQASNQVVFESLYWDQGNSTLLTGLMDSTPTGMVGCSTEQLQGKQASVTLKDFDFDHRWETTDTFPQLIRQTPIVIPLINESVETTENSETTETSDTSEPTETTDSTKTQEITIKGDIIPTLLSLKVPSTAISFSINPNLPSEEMFVAPTFELTNETNTVLTLAIETFEKIEGPFNDVLPTAHTDWTNLSSNECYDFALGIEPKGSEGWTSLVEGVRYVADDSNYELGTLAPKGTATFELTAKHGLYFPSGFDANYRLTFVIGLKD